jgi:hypothetical protein
MEIRSPKNHANATSGRLEQAMARGSKWIFGLLMPEELLCGSDEPRYRAETRRC